MADFHSNFFNKNLIPLKTVSDDLFRLIKSLTRSEKGYFKKFASRNTPGEKNNYIILFDAIDKMEVYDENLLKDKIKKASFINQLAVYKNYLFNLVLKSLQSYSTYETVDLKIGELIQNAKTLEKKTLLKEALKFLKKAKAIALKYENLKALHEILDYERGILMIMPDKHVYEKRSELYRQQKELLNNLARVFRYAWLSDKMVMYVEHKGDFRMEDREKEIKKIMSDPYVKDNTHLEDFASKRYYNHIHLFNGLSKEDMPMIHNYLKKTIGLINEYKHMIDVNARSYIHALVNYLLFSNLLKDKNGVRDAIEKINELRRKLRNKIPLDLELTIQTDSCYAEIIIYRNNGDIKKGRATALKIEKLLRDYKNEISMEMKAVLAINTACFYFLDENYEAALKFINLVINEIPPSFKKDQYDFSKLFMLLIHFELGNYDALENIIDSTYRFMRERKSIFGVEESLYIFLRRALRTDRNKLAPVYDELLYSLEKSKNEPQSHITLGSFDFITWAKSKVENKSLLELVKADSK